MLGRQRLEQRFTGPGTFKRNDYLPVHRSPPHPRFNQGQHNYRTLSLENGVQMDRADYVNISKVYAMDMMDARSCYKAYEMDAVSMNAVLQLLAGKARYVPGRQHQTTSIERVVGIHWELRDWLFRRWLEIGSIALIVIVQLFILLLAVMVGGIRAVGRQPPQTPWIRD